MPCCCPNRQIFLVDTHVNLDPTAEQIAEITLMAAEGVRRFGIEPRVALLSHSNFGTSDAPSALKMRRALRTHRARRRPRSRSTAKCTATARSTRACARRRCPRRRCTGAPTCWCLPNLDAANIAYNLLKTAAGNNRDDRPDAARLRSAGEYPHAVGDRAAHRQHDRADGGARERESACRLR